MTLTLTCAGGVPCVKGPKVLPKFFDSNMVLQRAPQSAVIYGSTAQPGETVTVSLSGGKSWHGTAAANGSWAVTLDPQQAGAGKTITVSTKSGNSQTLKNVAFGDVVLCSGQSNSAHTHSSSSSLAHVPSV